VIIEFKHKNPRSRDDVLHSFIDFGVPLIIIKFADGRTLELSDKHEDVLRILQRIIPERELPWKAI
jgi:hypothetical protein